LITGIYFSNVKYDVACFDIDEDKIILLSKGIYPIYEPGAGKLLKKSLDKQKIKFGSNK
jgi:UDPglucose 6-dehydrogenase